MRGEPRAGRREAAGDRGARSVQGRARLQIGEARRGDERTANMPPMSLTLDVSKLSGWLNADARCRVKKRACCAMWAEVRAGGRGRQGGGGRASGMHGERVRL